MVHDEWYAKLHGGTSQQYHYVGLVDPTASLSTTSGAENNLAPAGERVRSALRGAGGTAEDILFYVAGIYNSALAEEFLNEESGRELHIRIVEGALGVVAREIAQIGRHLRDLHHLLYDGPESGAVAAETLEALCSADVLSELGLVASRRAEKRFRAGRSYDLPSDFAERVKGLIKEFQSQLDELVEDLYD